VDEDCDGLIDNDDPSALGAIIYYVDADNDGYGSSSDPGTSYCYPPSGVVTDHSDCNDAKAGVHPGAQEICDVNDADEDCDGLTDDSDPSVIGKLIYYTDADNDGYGAPSDPGTAYCNPPSAKSTNNTDCNDANASVHPNGSEIWMRMIDGLRWIIGRCRSICNRVYYVDADNDGYGSSSGTGTAYCNPPAGV
jgi:hypothetical protein